MAYNLPFIKKVFNCTLPDYINWELLYNIGYCLDNESMKLYIVGDKKYFYFIYKCSQDGKITKQFNASKVEVDIEQINSYLGGKLKFSAGLRFGRNKADKNYDHLIIDTLEEDNYYVYCEESSFEQTIRFFEALALKYSVKAEDFFRVVSELNSRTISCFSDIYDYKAVSMVKVTLRDNNFKIYARPYKNGNNYVLTEKAKEFLLKLYDCSREKLKNHIMNLWVSYNFGKKQTTISTQNDGINRLLEPSG